MGNAFSEYLSKSLLTIQQHQIIRTIQSLDFDPEKFNSSSQSMYETYREILY